MEPRTLSQILSELNPIYDPQIKNVRARQAEIPNQVKAEEAGLQAKQTEAFDSILGGARRRGLGFSGIPLGEQAKYTSTEYLPALARLRQSGREQSLSLEDAILGINERRGSFAQQLQQAEKDRYAQMLENEKNRQAQLRASQASSINPTLGMLNSLAGGSTAISEVDPTKQKAISDVQQLLGRQNTPQFFDELIAIDKSAGYGNTYDQAKLQLLQTLQPGFFTNDNNKLDINRISRLRQVYGEPSKPKTQTTKRTGSGTFNNNVLGQPVRLF